MTAPGPRDPQAELDHAEWLEIGPVDKVRMIKHENRLWAETKGKVKAK